MQDSGDKRSPAAVFTGDQHRQPPVCQLADKFIKRTHHCIFAEERHRLALNLVRSRPLGIAARGPEHTRDHRDQRSRVSRTGQAIPDHYALLTQARYLLGIVGKDDDRQTRPQGGKLLHQPEGNGLGVLRIEDRRIADPFARPAGKHPRIDRRPDPAALLFQLLTQPVLETMIGSGNEDLGTVQDLVHRYRIGPAAVIRRRRFQICSAHAATPPLPGVASQAVRASASRASTACGHSAVRIRRRRSGGVPASVMYQPRCLRATRTPRSRP